MEKLSKIQIIEDTVAYYSEDTSRRALDENDYCVYENAEGKNCAFARYCINPKELNSKYGNTGRADLVLEQNGQEVLKEEYRGHDEFFWNSLQLFHDSHSNWDENGLTEIGKGDLEILKQKYKED